MAYPKTEEVVELGQRPPRLGSYAKPEPYSSKNQASRKRPPTQEEFWREQRARPDFQSHMEQVMKFLPRIVPYSYPITQPKPLDSAMDTQQTSDQPKRTSTTTKQTERDADSGSIEEDRQKGWEAQESMKSWLMSLPTGGELRAIWKI